MHGNIALRLQEIAAHREQILASIGRRLREEYDLPQPLPPRLAELVRKIEQPGSRIAAR